MPSASAWSVSSEKGAAQRVNCATIFSSWVDLVVVMSVSCRQETSERPADRLTMIGHNYAVTGHAPPERQGNQGDAAPSRAGRPAGARFCVSRFRPPDFLWLAQPSQSSADLRAGRPHPDRDGDGALSSAAGPRRL